MSRPACTSCGSTTHTGAIVIREGVMTCSSCPVPRERRRARTEEDAALERLDLERDEGIRRYR